MDRLKHEHTQYNSSEILYYNTGTNARVDIYNKKSRHILTRHIHTIIVKKRVEYIEQGLQKYIQIICGILRFVSFVTVRNHTLVSLYSVHT